MPTPKSATAGTTTEADTADEAAPWAPTTGALVSDASGRLGFVTGPGREPNTDLKESPEPLVAWLEATAAAPFGGELRPVS